MISPVVSIRRHWYRCKIMYSNENYPDWNNWERLLLMMPAHCEMLFQSFSEFNRNFMWKLICSMLSTRCLSEIATVISLNVRLSNFYSFSKTLTCGKCERNTAQTHYSHLPNYENFRARKSDCKSSMRSHKKACNERWTWENSQTYID